jgi:uncharacterized protein (TIGR02118 family)
MHKLVMLVETPEDETAFNDEWPLFLFLAGRMPGLRGETTSRVEKVLFGSVTYILMHELVFDSLDSLKEAMNSEEGRLAGTQVQKMAHGRLVLMITDHTEESLSNTPPSAQEADEDRPAQ